MNTSWALLLAICASSEGLLAGNCSNGSAGTTIFYINGIRTTEMQAEQDLGVLQGRVLAAVHGTPKSLECLAFRPNYNSTSGGLGLGDLWQSVRQRLNQDIALFTRYLADTDSAPDWFQDAFATASARIDESAGAPEIQAHVAQYESELNQGNTVLVVSHSQGNLYANAEYRKLEVKGWPIPNTDVFSIVSVATPAATVEGGGPWTTLFGDPIWLVPGSLGYTTTNLPLHLDGHAFVTRYLNLGSRSMAAIMADVVRAIPIRSSQPCPYAGVVLPQSPVLSARGGVYSLDVEGTVGDGSTLCTVVPSISWEGAEQGWLSVGPLQFRGIGRYGTGGVGTVFSWWRVDLTALPSSSARSATVRFAPAAFQPGGDLFQTAPTVQLRQMAPVP